ncbi:MAG: fluoride efflux transporter CrcB [Alphaproteobacteria bacterium]|nr:fluoride efflux transporter CrcB [Alphaproteobacteria bacterium]
MLMNYALVALGSAIGGMARYGTAQAINSIWKQPFPLAICLVNIIGSFAIGVFAHWLTTTQDETMQNNIKLVLMIGVCGGYTTFSTFSLETLNLLKSGETLTALAYIVASVVLCVGAAALGYRLGS